MKEDKYRQVYAFLVSQIDEALYFLDTGNLLEMGSREYFIGPTGKREQIVKDLDTLMKEVKKYARFDKVLVQAINGEPVKK